MSKVALLLLIVFIVVVIADCYILASLVTDIVRREARWKNENPEHK